MTISLQALLPLLVFCSISMAVWAVMTIVLGDRNRGAEDRLRRIMSPGTDRKGAEQRWDKTEKTGKIVVPT